LPRFTATSSRRRTGDRRTTRGTRSRSGRRVAHQRRLRLAAQVARAAVTPHRDLTEPRPDALAVALAELVLLVGRFANRSQVRRHDERAPVAVEHVDDLVEQRAKHALAVEGLGPDVVDDERGLVLQPLVELLVVSTAALELVDAHEARARVLALEQDERRRGCLAGADAAGEQQEALPRHAGDQLDERAGALHRGRVGELAERGGDEHLREAVVTQLAGAREHARALGLGRRLLELGLDLAIALLPPLEGVPEGLEIDRGLDVADRSAERLGRPVRSFVWVIV
jgi:hypothetical protein